MGLEQDALLMNLVAADLEEFKSYRFLFRKTEFKKKNNSFFKMNF